MEKAWQRVLIAVFINAFFAKRFGITSQLTHEIFLILLYGSLFAKFSNSAAAAFSLAIRASSLSFSFSSSKGCSKSFIYLCADCSAIFLSSCGIHWEKCINYLMTLRRKKGLLFELLNLTERVLSLMLSREDSEPWVFNLKCFSDSFGNFSIWYRLPFTSSNFNELERGTLAVSTLFTTLGTGFEYAFFRVLVSKVWSWGMGPCLNFETTE